ncbi:MAG TPA: hypothetical protein PK358_00100 [Spirochaetota bacterium]|nr:hypothetical protein [Spirochaetota bacterium]HPJ33202.1 hypothetical protein [Spirochaetota bacterium]
MKLIDLINSLMDRLEKIYESSKSLSVIGTCLALSFLFGIFMVEMNIRGMTPEFLSNVIPMKHLEIIAQVFTLVLCFEVVSLVFSFIHSVSISMGKQIEVLSLVLLRDVFKEFSNFTEPIDWIQAKPFLLPMISSALGAFALFFILGFYYRIYHCRPLTNDIEDTRNFIKIKKIIAFFLLISFIIIIIYEAIQYLKTGEPNKAFETFYTILIFSDILIILVSMRYSSDYLVTFRNSGFAVSTVFIRLALMSPPPFSALIGVGSALFAMGISMNYKYYKSSESCLEPEKPD